MKISEDYFWENVSSRPVGNVSLRLKISTFKNKVIANIRPTDVCLCQHYQCGKVEDHARY